MHFDVAVIGGGPAGSTLGTLLQKYGPGVKVGIFEREVFPRDHVGESQLPGTSAVLAEMGVWDKVEAADFPIKIGATYRWGKSADLWDFEFLPKEMFENKVRPAKYIGQRTQTAFQVDRAVYDKILLDHAEETGCEVYQGRGVRSVEREGDRVLKLVLDDGEEVTAEFFADASGHTGILRRAMGVESEVPTSLQNVAFWDYWQNAKWATEIGTGGTFVQVMSLGYGWLWFIPLGPTRTSVGLIVPAEYYKASGKRPEEMYREAIAEEPRISELMKGARSEEKFATTKDWSFLAERHSGENWFLVGESGGFADPILAAGLTITHVAAREAAYTILEMGRGRYEADWLRLQYDRRQARRISNHIRFADFWYSTNGQFSDLQDFSAQLAKDSGLSFGAQDAWRWIAQGGFIDEDLTFGTGGYNLETLKALPEFLGQFEAGDTFAGKNTVALHVDDSDVDVDVRAFYREGGVERVECYVRDGQVLPMRWVVPPLISILRREKSLAGVMERLAQATANLNVDEGRKQLYWGSSVRALEAMVIDGWASLGFDPGLAEFSLEGSQAGVRWSDSVTG